MKNTVTPAKPINQRQLKKLLNLSANEIRALKEDGTLQYQRVGTQDIFDETSVNRFMESFRIEDYLTIGRCRRILERCGYYTIRYKRQLVNNLGFYVTVAALTRKHPDIPEEYRLETTSFGKTQYIRRDQFKKTLNWMRDIMYKPSQNSDESNPLVINKPKKNTLTRKPKFKKMTQPFGVTDTSPSEFPQKFKTQRQLQSEALTAMVRKSGLVKRSPLTH